MSKNITIYCLFILSLLALPTTGFSQYGHFRFDYLTTRSGLSQNHVNCIFQDRDGFIWIGTYNGLNRYDGYNIKTFHSANEPDGLTQDAVNVIFQDSEGALWVGTDLGLNKYEPSTRTFSHYYNLYPDSTRHIENNIRTIYEDSDGKLWVGFYGGGIKVFDPETERFLNPEEVFKEELLPGHAKVNEFFVDQSGNYWIGTENVGLVEYNPRTEVIKRHVSKPRPGMLSDDLISSMTKDANGNLWIGTWNGGVNIYNPNSQTFEQFDPDGTGLFAQKPITDIFIEGNTAWIGTLGNGIFSVDLTSGEINHLLSDAGQVQGLNSDIVWTIFKDKSGVVWLGTYGGGVNLFYPGSDAFHSYRYSVDGQRKLQSCLVNAALELSDNTILLGMLGGGVRLFNRNNGHFSSLAIERDDNALNIRCLFQDDRKAVWVSSDKGLFRFDKDLKKKAFFPLSVGEGRLGDKSVYSVFQDRQGNLWFGLWGAGVRKLRSEDIDKAPDEVFFRSYETSHFAGNTVWSFFQDSKGRLWLGAGNGLFRYHYEEDSFVQEKALGNVLDGISISSFSEDWVNNRLVMGTLGRGMALMDMDDKSVEFVDEKSGLLRNEVFSIHSDAAQNFWICTNNGLSRYDTRNEQFRHINVEMGMQENELLNKSWLLSWGEILVGSNNGFYLFDPSRLVDSPFEPNVVITDFLVNNADKPLMKKDNLIIANLRATENTFSLEFAALDYRMSDKIEYQYKLEGFDENWINAHAGNRRVTYTNMDGGEYIFKVRASNSDGLWTGREKRVEIKLASPFYKRLVFQVLFLFFPVGLFFVFLRIREKKIKSNLQKRNDLFNLDLLKQERNTLENRLNEKEMEFAAVKIFIREKEERLLALRDQISEALERARPEVKNTVNRLLCQIESETNNSEARQEYLDNIDLLHDGYIDRLAKAFPRLTQKDLQICAYIKGAKSNKEIAAQMGISSQSVEMSRYRIRKKMNLDSSLTLNDFLVRF
jgi:ligand-binding sensor domain-containing protein